MIPAKRTPAAAFGVAAIAALAWMAGCEGQPSEPVVTSVRLEPGGGGPPPKVDEADPPSAEQDTTLDVRVLGSNFDDGSTVEYTIDGVPQPKVRTNSVVFVSKSELVSNITVDPDAPLDLYDVEVTTTRGKKGIGADKFEVVVKGGGKPVSPTGTVELSGGFMTTTPQPVGIDQDDDKELRFGGASDENDQLIFEAATSLTVTHGVVQAAMDALVAAGSTVVPDGRLFDAGGTLLCIFSYADTKNPPPRDIPMAEAQKLVDRLAEPIEYKRRFQMIIEKPKLGSKGDHVTLLSYPNLPGHGLRFGHDSQQFPDKATVVENPTDVFTISGGVIRVVERDAPPNQLRINCPNQGDTITVVLVRD